MSDFDRTKTPPLVSRPVTGFNSPDRKRDRAPLRSRPNRSSSDSPPFDPPQTSNPRIRRLPPSRQSAVSRPLEYESQIGLDGADADDELDVVRIVRRKSAPRAGPRRPERVSRAAPMQNDAEFVPHSAPSQFHRQSLRRRRSESPPHRRKLFSKANLSPVHEQPSLESSGQFSDASISCDTSTSGGNTTDSATAQTPREQATATFLLASAGSESEAEPGTHLPRAKTSV